MMATTITLQPDTVKKIKLHGNMGDTYDDVINQVIDELDKLQDVQK